MEPSADLDRLAKIAVDCAYRIHQDLGPGLLESVYEAVMEALLIERGLRVRRQAPIGIRYGNLIFEEGFKIDLLVDDKLVIELKSVERHSPVHLKQVLTYLRLADCKLGLLINFGANQFGEGVKRVINNRAC